MAWKRIKTVKGDIFQDEEIIIRNAKSYKQIRKELATLKKQKRRIKTLNYPKNSSKEVREAIDNYNMMKIEETENIDIHIIKLQEVLNIK